jgi:hypothetical protein
MTFLAETGLTPTTAVPAATMTVRKVLMLNQAFQSLKRSIFSPFWANFSTVIWREKVEFGSKQRPSRLTFKLKSGPVKKYLRQIQAKQPQILACPTQ